MLRGSGIFRHQNHGPGAGFTLLELLAVVAVIVVLAGVIVPALTQSHKAARRIQCVSNLRQLGIAAALYWQDNAGHAFRYRRGETVNGSLYWFGWLEGGPEGTRHFDPTRGCLYPYLQGRGVETCPSLDYALDNFKIKATAKAYGYGYNLHLSRPVSHSPFSIRQARNPSQLAVLADAAQVNTFQPPASPDNPMLEEFYYINASEPTTHFRHLAVRANVVFADLHVDAHPPAPHSLDERMPSQHLGHLTRELLQPHE